MPEAIALPGQNPGQDPGQQTGRQQLLRRYRHLRDPRGAVPVLTLRAARFAAARRACTMDLETLASRPEWQFHPERDHQRFCETIGLVACAVALSRALDGSAMRQLASHFGEDLLDRALDEADTPHPAPRPTGDLAPHSFTMSDLRASGTIILEAAETGEENARLLCERAWAYRCEEDMAA